MGDASDTYSLQPPDKWWKGTIIGLVWNIKEFQGFLIQPDKAPQVFLYPEEVIEIKGEKLSDYSQRHKDWRIQLTQIKRASRVSFRVIIQLQRSDNKKFI